MNAVHIFARVHILLLLGLAYGCAGAPERYPDTDVIRPDGLELRSATDLEKSSGVLWSGTLVFAGEADLIDVYEDYVAAMREIGWVTTHVNIAANKAIATLRKNGRAAHLEFLALNEIVRATIRVTRLERPTG